MNKKKFSAVLIAFSLMLCGCNNTIIDPTVTTTDGNSTAESDTLSQVTQQYEETSENTQTSAEETPRVPESTPDTEVTEKTVKTEDTSSETESEETTIDVGSEVTEDIETENESSSAFSAPPVTTKVTAVSSVSTAKETTPPVTEPPATVTEPPATTAAPAEPSPATVLTPAADGILTSGNALATVDYSHTSDGYVMAKYTGAIGTIKVRITGPTGVSQIYNLNSDGKFESYPLTASDGSYTIDILERVAQGYAFAHTFTFNVTLSNPLAPFLRPSQYVNYSYGDSAVTLGSQLCAGTTTALEKVDRVYSWLVDNVVYDHEFAASDIAGGYAGDTSKVVNQKKGICLDYAATMAAMLRSQNVPTQVISGDVNGGGFHAWVNVYVQDVGWVYGGSIYFDGSAWHRMDPTYAASSHSDRSILDFIANGSNYVQDYVF